MPDFRHSQAAPDPTSPADAARNARVGLALFAVYAALYAAFMLVTTFALHVMGTEVFAGVNLAVAYGLALIATAFVIALVYAWLCRAPAAPGTGP